MTGRKREERSPEPQGLGSVLDQMVGEGHLRAGLALGRLGRRWEDVVGERMAIESTPVRLDGGVLFVRASSAAWAAQLGFLSRQLADRANDVLKSKAVRQVRIVVDGRSPVA